MSYQVLRIFVYLYLLIRLWSSANPSNTRVSPSFKKGYVSIVIYIIPHKCLDVPNIAHNPGSRSALCSASKVTSSLIGQLGPSVQCTHKLLFLIRSNKSCCQVVLHDNWARNETSNYQDVSIATMKGSKMPVSHQIFTKQFQKGQYRNKG